MAPITLHFDAILFDMDGTLVDSTAGVVGAWEVFRETYTGIDVKSILSSAHGVRTVDNLRKYCGINDAETLEKEAERFEQAIVTSSTQNGRNGIVLLPGASDVLGQLFSGRLLPKPCWAICTSATRSYALSAVRIAGVPIPDVFVAAEDVVQGKPNPDPYLLGAKKCNVKPENCIVFEDAPSGIRSGRDAGCKTVGLLTTHSQEEMEASGADFIVKNLSSVSVKMAGGGVDVTIRTD
ncbi:HAD-like domain-containing protein [Infundibulicybe gibba]|nr:HAD-like domain-containing protein [Infundibulicybe gibba]